MDVMDVATLAMETQAKQVTHNAAMSVLKMTMDMQQQTADSLLRILNDTAMITGKGMSVDISA